MAKKPKIEKSKEVIEEKKADAEKKRIDQERLSFVFLGALKAAAQTNNIHEKVNIVREALEAEFEIVKR